MTHSVLITGANGQVGIELGRSPWPQGWRAVASTRDVLDLADPVSIKATVSHGHDGRPWAAVINAGAYTAVDKAESDLVSAWQVNALAPAALAAACAANDIPLVHVSTDYVFAGDKLGAWEVEDTTTPLGVYGASKLGGEWAVRTSGARHAIVRTAWVVSAHGRNFVKTMLRLASEREVLGVVHDQRGSPTGAADLAQALSTITMRIVGGQTAPSGTFHFSNRGETSWAEFATEIFRQSELRGGPVAVVEPIATDAYPTPARRPANSVLSHAAIGAAYGIVPRPWEESLSEILDELIGEPK